MVSERCHPAGRRRAASTSSKPPATAVGTVAACTMQVGYITATEHREQMRRDTCLRDQFTLLHKFWLLTCNSSELLLSWTPGTPLSDDPPPQGVKPFHRIRFYQCECLPVRRRCTTSSPPWPRLPLSSPPGRRRQACNDTSFLGIEWIHHYLLLSSLVLCCHSSGRSVAAAPDSASRGGPRRAAAARGVDWSLA